MDTTYNFSASYRNKSNFSKIESIKKKRRRVTFSLENNNVKEIGKSLRGSDCGSITASNATNVCWYSRSELDEMRKDVKIQAKVYIKSLNKECNDSNHHMSSLVMPFHNSGVDNKMISLCNSSSSFRGLEPKIFAEKQRNRIIATSTVLEYQRRTDEILKAAEKECVADTDIEEMKKGFANRLGIICTQLSKWSKDEARAIATYDASGIYKFPTNNLTLTTNDDINNMPTAGSNPPKFEQNNAEKNQKAALSSIFRKRPSAQKIIKVSVVKRPRTVSPILFEDSF